MYTQIFMTLQTDTPAQGGDDSDYVSDFKQFKMAEMMVSLAAAGLPPVSRIGLFEQPPLGDLRRLREAQHQPMPVWAMSSLKSEDLKP